MQYGYGRNTSSFIHYPTLKRFKSAEKKFQFKRDYPLESNLMEEYRYVRDRKNFKKRNQKNS